MTGMRTRVLVTPAGTEIGHEVAESLRYSKHFEIVGANTILDHSEYMFSKLFTGIPFANEAFYVDKINALVREAAIDIVMPTHDDASFALSERVKSSSFAGPRRSLADILRFKRRTIEHLSGIVPVPQTYCGAEISFPAFIKPDRGQGSRGAKIVNSAADLGGLRLDDFLLQEYLPGREATIDCFSDPNSEVLFVGPRLRERISGGIATRMRSFESSELTEFAGSISKTLGLTGAWFFQVKGDSFGCFKLLEVANRIAGSSGHLRIQGINLVEAWLHQLSGRKIEFPARSQNASKLTSDRALYYKILPPPFRTVYVDFDDTLYFLSEGRINARLVGALFGLKLNKGVSIHLLTRHAGEIEEILRRIGLDKLFDDIHHLRAGERKSDYILDDAAVFMDDSFKERNEVAGQLRGVICLPPEAVEYLEGRLLL